ncbi:hypothetical protein RCO28_30920 [Streptomyces sp. LHD-70]|uniref:DUF7848 domain-containing protein n=1 Tax=Streptomyces sp. LHD-70 TaxID=3072140 RepID=UPI00280D6AD8|nr:hypothetical protein [Streptomyces sp. LHD-70]MDQ8706850.1 hypothetical protein [Streptomyces sp. LHD-70]
MERSKDQSDPDVAQLWCLKHAGRTHHSGYELTLVQQFNATVAAPPATPAVAVQKVPVSDELAVALARYRERLPPEQFLSGQLTSEVAAIYGRESGALPQATELAERRESGALPQATELAERCRELLDDEDGEGFVVLQLAGLQDAAGSTAAFTRAVTALLALVATPLSVLKSQRLWNATDATAGAIPLHLEIPNSTWPPDYCAYLCVRADLNGQGRSLVSNSRRAVSRLGHCEAEVLSHQRYKIGPLRDLVGVGVEWPSFPVIDGMATQGGYVRFAPNMVNDSDTQDPYARATRSLEAELITGQRKVQLDAGDLLIVNQHLCCYGREPLGEGPADVPGGEEQLVLRSFLRRQGPPLSSGK